MLSIIGENSKKQLRNKMANCQPDKNNNVDDVAFSNTTNNDVGDSDTALSTNAAAVESPLGLRTPPPSRMPTSEALTKSASAPYPRFAPVNGASSSQSAELTTQELLDRSDQILSECRSRRHKRSLPTAFTYDPPAIKRADRTEEDSEDSAGTSTSSVRRRAARHRDEDEDYVQMVVEPSIQSELFYDDKTVIAQTMPTAEETVGDRPLPQMTPISDAITADLTGAMLLEESTNAPQTVFIFNDLYVQFHQRQVYFSWPCPETGVMQRGEKVTKQNWDILRIETVARKNAGLPSIGQFFGEAVAAATREHRAGRNRRTISSESAVMPAPMSRARSTGVESGPPSANRTPQLCAICGRLKGADHMRVHDATDRPFMCVYGCKLTFFNALGVLKTHTWKTHKRPVDDNGRRQLEQIVAEGKSLACPHCDDNSCTSVKELEKHCRALHMIKKPERSTTTLDAPAQPHVENDMEETVTDTAEKKTVVDTAEKETVVDTAEKETSPVPEEVFQQGNEPGTSSESTATNQSESSRADTRRKERIKTLENLIANAETHEISIKYLDLLTKVMSE